MCLSSEQQQPLESQFWMFGENLEAYESNQVGKGIPRVPRYISWTPHRKLHTLTASYYSTGDKPAPITASHFRLYSTVESHGALPTSFFRDPFSRGPLLYGIWYKTCTSYVWKALPATCSLCLEMLGLEIRRYSTLCPTVIKHKWLKKSPWSPSSVSNMGLKSSGISG